MFDENFYNRTLIRDRRMINARSTLENDSWKIAEVRARTVVFNVRSWKTHKIFAAKNLGSYDNSGRYID